MRRLRMCRMLQGVPGRPPGMARQRRMLPDRAVCPVEEGLEKGRRMDRFPVVGLIGIGEMGAGIGGALTRAGVEVRTVVAGRGPESRTRAAEAGLIAVDDLSGLAAAADLVISVLPPDRARSVAAEFAGCLPPGGGEGTFLEANAISPGLVRDIAALFPDPGTVVIDGGIVGGPPSGESRPRLYVSGPECAHLQALDGLAFDIRRLAGGIGRASAFKMVYAALTKGTNALMTNVALCAESFGFLEEMMDELSASQAALAERARSDIPRLPCDAGRWVREMLEIRDTFRAQGLPGGFHEAAAEIMRILEASRFGSETRRTRDRSRSLSATVRGVAADREAGS